MNKTTIRQQDLDRWLDELAHEPESYDAGLEKLVAEHDHDGLRLLLEDPLSWRDPLPAQAESRARSIEEQFRIEVDRIRIQTREEEARLARRIEFARARYEAALERAGIAPEDIPSQHPESRGNLDAEGDSGLPQEVLLRWDELHSLRTELVERNLYLVLINVERYSHTRVSRMDLIQEGASVLFRAVDGFDWRRDVRFRTYAQYWVHQAVLKMLYNSARTVRVPIWVQKVLGKIRRAQEAGRREGRELTPMEIAERIEVPVSKVDWVLSTRRYAVSLDAEVGEGDGVSLGQLLTADDDVPVPDAIPPGDLSEVLADVMSDLPHREQGILRRRFGLDGDEPETLGEIAQDLGITAERVRQLQNAALGRIKRPSKLRRLKAFVD